MDRRGFSTGATAAVAGVFYSLFGGAKRGFSQGTAGQVIAETAKPDPWAARGWKQGGLIQEQWKAWREPGIAALRIWEGYGLQRPNDYDTVERFREAILYEWGRNRPAYVWRTSESTGRGALQVYVLPARFVIAHPPFLPDYPNGYYRIDPACEWDDARACIPPSAFFRILPAETVDEYPPPAAA